MLIQFPAACCLPEQWAERGEQNTSRLSRVDSSIPKGIIKRRILSEEGYRPTRRQVTEVFMWECVPVPSRPPPPQSSSPISPFG